MCFRMDSSNGGAGPQTVRPIVGLAHKCPVQLWGGAIKDVKFVKFVKPPSGLLARAKRGLTNLMDLMPLTSCNFRGRGLVEPL